MKLEEILSQERFNLPYQISHSGKFSAEKLHSILYNYQSAIDDSTDLFDGIFRQYYATTFMNEALKPNTFKDDIKNITSNIQLILNAYLKGFPSKAFLKFDEMLSNNELKSILGKTKALPKNTSLYRLRNDDAFIKPLTSQQLFHVPFELRHRIDTKRYSIPGYPCLYASDSLYVACKEMDVDGKIESVKSVRLTNNIKLRYVDVAARDIRRVIEDQKNPTVGTDDKVIHEIFEYALIYPIIASCHTRINYGSPSPFRAEYVFPQLLLQWFVEFTPQAVGIRYFSNRMTFSEYTNRKFAYNFVFPVKNCQGSGYCTFLTSIFNSTEVIEASAYNFEGKTSDEQIFELQSILENTRSKVFFS